MNHHHAAKNAYNAYAYRMGRLEPYEFLSQTEQLAWYEAYVAVTGAPPITYDTSKICQKCAGVLRCPGCDAPAKKSRRKVDHEQPR